MKVKVYETIKEKESIVRLKMQQSGDTVQIIAVDEMGRPNLSGHICHFSPDGKLVLNTGVNEKLGFDLDSTGQIKTR